MMVMHWYIRTGNLERGPISSEALKNLALEGKITPETPVRKGAGGAWVSARQVKGLFPLGLEDGVVQPAIQHQPPPILTPIAIPIPNVLQTTSQGDQATSSPASRPHADDRRRLDVFQVVLLSIGAAGLALLAISSCLTWIRFMDGGVLGIEGNGKFLLFGTLALGAGLGVELVFYKRAGPSILLAQGWGTIAALWMAGEIWRVIAIRQAPEIGKSVFGRMMALQLTPGIGLFVALLAGLGVAIVFAILATQCLKKPFSLGVTQTLSLLIGIGIVVAILPQRELPPTQESVNMWGSESEEGLLRSGPSSEVASTKTSPATLGETIHLGHLKVTPKSVELRKVQGRHNQRETREPVLVLTLIVENTSQGEVFSPIVFAKGKDNFGNDLSKVGGEFGSFSPEGSAEHDDLKPGQKATLIVCLEPKIATAESYQWEISQRCNNQEHGYKTWTLKFNTSEVIRTKPDIVGSGALAKSASDSDGEWHDARKPFRREDMQIEVIRVFVGKVPLRSLGDEQGVSKNSMCQIGLRITNLASASKVDYQGWQGNSLSSDARLTDDVGNRYKGVEFGFGTKIFGQVKSESIYPEKSIEDVLVFEPPVRAAKYLNLEPILEPLDA